MKKADILLRSNAIYTGCSNAPSKGFVAISGNRILAIGNSDGAEYASDATQILDLKDQLICPGFVDTHCFFTGYLLTIAGWDFSNLLTQEQVLHELERRRCCQTPRTPLLARGLMPSFPGLTTERLDTLFGDTPVILFMDGKESCYMNTSARSTFGFTPETCWSESYWRLLKYLLGQQEFSVPAFKDYMAMMNCRGITSVKEMGFDDFYGFADVLKELEEKKELTMRVHFMSQPVGAPMNLCHGRQMRERFTGPFVAFSGFNQMTDGSISQLEGEMKAPYLCADTCCIKQIDWEGLRADALAADSEDFRFSLHAQGDGAIGKTVDIFAQCKTDANGRLKNRHAITDLECSDPADLERMGKLGIIAEIYPQIMSIADREGKLAMISEKIGTGRGKNYWNRRKMADSGIVISCATDLPLLYDDIGESIYHTVGGQFPEGGEPFNIENTLTVAELLKAWTYGGQYNLGREQVLGTLSEGMLADIAVLDHNVFEIPMEQMRDVRVSLTIVDGNIAYKQ